MGAGEKRSGFMQPCVPDDYLAQCSDVLEFPLAARHSHGDCIAPKNSLADNLHNSTTSCFCEQMRFNTLISEFRVVCRWILLPLLPLDRVRLFPLVSTPNDRLNYLAEESKRVIFQEHQTTP